MKLPGGVRWDWSGSPDHCAHVTVLRLAWS